MRKLVCVLAAVVAFATPALADCGQNGPVATPMRGALPLSANASEAEKAALAAEYLQFSMAIEERPRTAPPGYYRGPQTWHLFGPVELAVALYGGFHAVSFIHCTTNFLVVVIDNTSNLADLRGILVRQLVTGGASPLARAFVQDLMEAYPGYYIAVVGHSAGGGIAAWLAGEFGLPSVILNGMRTRAAIAANDGSEQLVVIVNGDPVGDPRARDEGLAHGGTYLYLPHDERFRPHTLRALNAGLEQVLQ